MDSISYGDLNCKINELIKLVEKQSQQIGYLESLVINMQKEFAMFSLNIKNLVETRFTHFENMQKYTLLLLKAEGETQHDKICKTVIDQMDEYILKNFSEVTAKVLSYQIQFYLVPLITVKIGNIFTQIRKLLEENFAIFDLKNKDKLEELFKNRCVIDNFTKAVLNGVQGSLKSMLYEPMSNKLVQSFEKSSQQMFRKLSEQFPNNLNEIMKSAFDNTSQRMLTKICDEFSKRIMDIVQRNGTCGKHQQQPKEVLKTNDTIVQQQRPPQCSCFHGHDRGLLQKHKAVDGILQSRKNVADMEFKEADRFEALDVTMFKRENTAIDAGVEKRKHLNAFEAMGVGVSNKEMAKPKDVHTMDSKIQKSKDFKRMKIKMEETQESQDVKVIETNLKTQKSVTLTKVYKREDIKDVEVQMQYRKKSEVNICGERSDLKATINLHLALGLINEAFHIALSAGDLDLVSHAMKSTKIKSVFTPECCLEQRVILSLIQQITLDMKNHDRTKQNYLKQAFLNLDPKDPVILQNVYPVLSEVFVNCESFLNNYPMNPQFGNVRIFMREVQVALQLLKNAIEKLKQAN